MLIFLVFTKIFKAYGAEFLQLVLLQLKRSYSYKSVPQSQLVRYSNNTNKFEMSGYLLITLALIVVMIGTGKAILQFC